MTPIRLGCVKYLNTLPMIEGLRACRDVELIAAAPSKLIEMLERDEVDLALASVIDAARPREAEVTLLPVGMIGCDGPTMTVRVFSGLPLDQVAEVHADTDSHTSTALMQVVMHRKFGRRVRVIEFDARERVTLTGGGPEWPTTMLLIGDKVVTDAPPAERYPHQLDLGAAWKELTGLPFVYATWMCKSARVDDPAIRVAAALLERQRLHNATRLDWIVHTRAPERRWPPELAAEYVGNRLRYEVGEREEEAVNRFLRDAAELGLASGGEVRWAREAATLAR
jgi:chorismate dehydratase